MAQLEYFGVAGFIKPGLRLEQMNAVQKAAAWEWSRCCSRRPAWRRRAT